MLPPTQNSGAVPQLFGVFLRSIPVSTPLPCDFYIYIDEKPVLFKKTGDSITSSRLKSLYKYRVTKLYIPIDQKMAFRKFMWGALTESRPSCNEEAAGIFRQTGFLLAEALFTSSDPNEAIKKSSLFAKESTRFIGEEGWKSVRKIMTTITHDDYSYNHAVNISALAMELTGKIFGESEQDVLWQAALGGFIHDIGERMVELAILEKKEPLVKQEILKIQQHPVIGAKFLESLPKIPESSKRIVNEHHENFDGTGYPNGLTGEKIDILARIVSLCDVYDSLTSDRPYRQKLSTKEALELMQSMQPGRFDPTLLVVFLRIVKNN